ncbi:MAG: iron-containing alcohol dehydrogenase [Candidatus Bathyarchaeia archaeon]
MQVLTFPRTVVMGDGALEYLKSLEGKKALIVCGATVKKMGFVDKITGYLKEAGIEAKAFEVEPEPSKETVAKGAELANKYGPDWIIGLGGGSNIDAAKAIWFLYERPDMDLGAINPFIKLGLRKKAKLICIPTTSGSGSDVSFATVITDLKEERKMELANSELVPDISIIEPTFPMAMPQKLVADTGFDALSHSLEAFIANQRNDFSDALSMRATQLIFKYLPRAYKNPEDKEAREKMHNASTMAGMAFTQSNVALGHALGHVIGGIFHVPHGKLMAIFTTYVIEYNAKKVAERYAEIAKAIGIEAKTTHEAVEKLVETIKELRSELGEPASLKEAGIKPEDFYKRLDELTERVMKSVILPSNPRPLTVEEARKLLEYIYEGKKIDF